MSFWTTLAPMTYTFKGSDAARARALARKIKRPKFALGQVVIDLAAIDAIYADLQAAEDAGVIDDAKAWLRVQQKRPRTKANEVWYSLVFGHGAGLGGQRDLKIAPRGAKSNP